MIRNVKETWSLAELAEETGLSPRTIRYYISRALLEGPVVAGRGAAYDAGHLARLRKIQELQSQGAMLAEISRTLAVEHPKAALPSPDSWDRYQIDDDVVVWVRSDVAPWRNKEVRKALGEFAAKIKREENHANDDGKS
jgi:DNA-binding transcriptional MerR regulator